MMIAEVIRLWRKQRGLSVREAAQLIPVSHMALWRFELGRELAQEQWVKIFLWLLSPTPYDPAAKNKGKR